MKMDLENDLEENMASIENPTFSAEVKKAEQ